MRARVTGQLAFASLVVACGSDGFTGVVREPPAPPASTTDPDTTETTAVDPESSTSTTSDAVGDACAADTPCPADVFCVAPNAGGATVGVGAYACSSTCVEPDDPTRWCLDAASCCNADATCELGFCRVASVDESSSDGSTDTSTSG